MIPKSVGLTFSARRKLPVLLAYDGEYWPHQFIGLLWRTLGWHRIEENEEYGIYEIGDQKIKLLRKPNKQLKSPCYTREFFAHCFQDWRRQYAPPFNLKGKTVMDVGSGVGETAFLFFKWGAKRVIAIDQNPRACSVAEENAEANGWDMVVLNESFNPEHMKIHWDFAKLDIEGGESCLLEVDKLPVKPVVAEIHSTHLIGEFSTRFNFKIHEVLRRDDGVATHAIMRRCYEGIGGLI